MNRYLKGSLLVIISALIYGSMPIVAKAIYQHGVNAVSLVFYRNFFAILPLLFWVRRRGEGVRFDRKRILPIAFLTLFGGAFTPMLLFASYPYISSGVATTVHFIYPVFVLLGCTLFFKEPLSLTKSACVGLCSAGILCFYTPGGQTSPLGLALSFASGITFAVYVIGLNKSAALKGMSAVQLSCYMAIICSAVLLVGLLTTKTLTFPDSAKIWLLCAAFALTVTLGATVCFQTGAFIVGSQRAAILSTFEPIASIVLGIVALREPFGILTAIGSAMILAAVLLLTVWDRKAVEAGSR